MSSTKSLRTNRTAQPPDEQCLLLYDMSWEEYEAVLRAFHHRRLRISYDQGTLEIMTLSFEHERGKGLLRRLLELLAEELEKDIVSSGSITLKRRKLQKGLEPDESYYFDKSEMLRGKRRLDLRRDPAPDLVLEVDVTSSSMNRMQIYAALKVSEVWRYDGEKFRLYGLRPNGSYAERAHSVLFPMITAAILEKFFTIGLDESELVMVRAFRSWIRELPEVKKSHVR